MSRRQSLLACLSIVILLGLGLIFIIRAFIIPNWAVLVDMLKPRLAYHWLGDSTLPVQLAWEFTADEIITDPPMFGEDGTVYLKAGTYVYALDPDTGEVKWQFRRSSHVWGSILPLGDLVLVTTEADQVLQALRAEDGEAVWRISVDDLAQTSAPLLSFPPAIEHLSADEQRIYVGLDLHGGNQVLALEPHTGQLLWKSPPRPFPASMSSAPEQFIISSRELFFLDKEIGALVRSEQNNIYSYRPRLYTKDTMYTSGGIARAIALDTLEEKWRISHGCSSWDPRIPEPPEVVDDVAYFLTTCHLAYAVNTDNGRLLWRYADKNERNVLSFVVYQGMGYLMTADATLHAVDLETGREMGELTSTPDVMPFETRDYLAANEKLLLVHYRGYQLFAFSEKGE
jgi:outer membrane protein assembly factor BamB